MAPIFMMMGAAGNTGGSGESGLTWDSTFNTSNVSYSNGNLTVAGTGYVGQAKTTVGVAYNTTDKYYYEIYVDAVGGASATGIGVCRQYTSAVNVGEQNDTWGYRSNGAFYSEGNYNPGYFDTYTTGDIIGVAFDFVNGQISFYKNGTQTGSTQSISIASGQTYRPSVSLAYPAQASSTNTARFASGDFSYTPPTGFDPWPAS